MNVSLGQDFARRGVQPWTRCDHCAIRLHAPCGAIQDAIGMSDLERARAPSRHVPAGDALFEQGAPSDRSFTILRGWVAVTQVTSDGRFLILRFALPGDVVAFERRSSVNRCGAVAVGDATVCSFTRSRQGRLELEHPSFDARHRAAEGGILEDAEETLASIMGRGARERVSHLLFQLAWRGLRRRPSPGDEIDAPLSQIQIGLATGLTAVHVSRTMRRLRESRVVAFESHRLTIHDPAALERLAGVSTEGTALWS